MDDTFASHILNLIEARQLNNIMDNFVIPTDALFVCLQCFCEPRLFRSNSNQAKEYALNQRDRTKGHFAS